MEAESTKMRNRFAAWFRLCPVRHVLIAAGGLVLAAYFALRGNAALMAAVSREFVTPWRLALVRATGKLPFSLAEVLIVAGALAALAYLAFTVAGFFRRPGRAVRAYRFVMTCLAAFCVIYGGFCLLWGVYFYTSDFEAQSGIRGMLMTREQLEEVTRHFTDLVNEYGEQVPRSENGEFSAPREAYFPRSPELYEAVEKIVPCLEGAPTLAKPFFFSRCMSYMDFTGFYFPLTGEANINTDCPACLIPSTIAHELAHQRGVAQEDEANFCAVLSCLADGDPLYCYSACLLAYIHLGNALYAADYDAWLENYQRLSPGVRADLDANRAYWARFETPVSKVSDTIYTGLLHSYGQTLGLQTYGKCVDLLAAYYYGPYRAMLEQ